MGGEKLQATAERLGFNGSFDFGGMTFNTGKVDIRDATDIELAWAAVGQYTVSANPMQMLMLTTAIANGGTSCDLHISSKDAGTGRIKLLERDEAEELSKMMRDTVQYYYGDYFFENMEVAAKTGTAEVDGRLPNAWMVGFSRNEDTPYAFVVIIENAGSGLGDAGNLASVIMNMARDKGI